MSHGPRPRSELGAVAAGGAAGAVLRWAVGVAVPDGGALPWATLAVNVLGAFLLGLLAGSALVRRRPVLGAALGPGLLGGFTTFSAYAAQSRALVADGRVAVAAAYVVGTAAGCLVAVAVARLLVGRASREAVR